MNQSPNPSTLQLIRDLWPLALGLLALVVWAIRLEFNTAQNKKDLNALGKKGRDREEVIRQREEKVVEFMSEIKESLARMEGKSELTNYRLSHMDKEIERINK